MAYLNGLTGTVVGPDVERPGRWQVDLGEAAEIGWMSLGDIFAMKKGCFYQPTFIQVFIQIFHAKDVMLLV